MEGLNRSESSGYGPYRKLWHMPSHLISSTPLFQSLLPTSLHTEAAWLHPAHTLHFSLLALGLLWPLSVGYVEPYPALTVAQPRSGWSGCPWSHDWPAGMEASEQVLTHLSFTLLPQRYQRKGWRMLNGYKQQLPTFFTQKESLEGSQESRCVIRPVGGSYAV